MGAGMLVLRESTLDVSPCGRFVRRPGRWAAVWLLVTMALLLSPVEALGAIRPLLKSSNPKLRAAVEETVKRLESLK
jgi:hypothetical protein